MQIIESRILHEIPRSAGNPRNSEGAFLPLADGSILFAYSRYTGNDDEDDANCDIAAITIRNDHFSEPVLIATAAEHGVRNIMSVSLLRMQNGDIGLFYLVKNPTDGTSSYVLRRSADEGKSFCEPVQCLPDCYPGYYIVNNDRVLQTSDGRLLIPAAFHHVGKRADGTPRPDYHGESCFFCSEDDGRTFHAMGQMLSMPHPSETGLQEPGVIELPGGTLYAYFRTDRMCQYESVSINGGRQWFTAQPSAFTAPESPMKIARNPYSGLYYAVWNPAPLYNGRDFDPKGCWITAGRTPLVIARSENGVDFSEPVPIETDPSHGYCYPAILFLSEKEMLLSYCSGGAQDGKCLNRTTIRKLVVN